MFYEGGVQGGIAEAVQKQQFVVCFIHNENAESLRWEGYFWENEEVSTELGSKAVVLKMPAGSQEAASLSAFCPITSIPIVILIKNGQLAATLGSGLTATEFMHKLLRVLRTDSAIADGSGTIAEPEAGSSSQNPTSQIQSSSTLPSESLEPETSSQPEGFTLSPPGPDSQTRSARSQELPTTRRSENTREFQTQIDELRERRRVEEEQYNAKLAREKAEKKAKAGKQKAEEAANEGNTAKSKQFTYAQQQKKRQQEAKRERQRILDAIANDKIERKEKEERRRAAVKAGANDHSSAEDINEQSQVQQKDFKPQTSNECALQIRLFDGSTIRSRFSPDSTLGTDVRPWIDSHGNKDRPYTFRLVSVPVPNRAITISQEDETLQSLGLTPSATLITVPIREFAAAYEPDTGYVSRGISTGYNLVSGGVGLVGSVGSTLGSLLSFGQTGNPSLSRPDGTGAPVDEIVQGVNVRTLGDHRQPQDDQQLYNGNQLNFEPRPDDDKKDS